MRFRLIDAKKAALPINRMCALLDVSVSGYYAWRRRGASQRQLDDMVWLAHIRARFAASNGTYGSPRMHVDLREDGLSIGRHRTARLMRDNALKANQKRRFQKTTDSNHGGPIAANLLDQDFTCEQPDRKWGVDISYVWTTEGGLYLAIVLDLFSRRIPRVGLRPPEDRLWLGRKRPVEKGPGAGSPATRHRRAQSSAGAHPSFRSRQSVLFSRLSEAPESPWHDLVHEWQRELLRQRHGRDRI